MGKGGTQELKSDLAQEFFNSLPGGLVSSLHIAVLQALEYLCYVLDVFETNRSFAEDLKKPDEKKIYKARCSKCCALRALKIG